MMIICSLRVIIPRGMDNNLLIDEVVFCLRIVGTSLVFSHELLYLPANIYLPCMYSYLPILLRILSMH